MTWGVGFWDDLDMTAVTTESRAVTRGQRRLRAGLWLIHAALLIFGAVTVLLGATERWLDLRGLPGMWQTGLPVVWLASLAGFTLLVGPRFRGIRPVVWASGGLRARYAWPLLVPTMLLLVPLAGETIRFYRVVAADQADTWPVPTAGVALLAVAAWVILAMWWLAKRELVTASGAQVGRWGKVLYSLWMVVVFAGAMGFCLVNDAERVPRGAVDLAVVFGHRVMEDGTSSATMRGRTLAAVELYRTGLVRYIMVSGSIDPMKHGGMQSEALAMAAVCRENHVPEEALIVDPVGVNTRATVENSKRVMAKLGLKTVVACSSDYHLARIRLAYGAAGVDAYAVAARREDLPEADLASTVREMVALPIYYLFPSYRSAKVVQMAVKSPRIVVMKSERKLELFDGDRLVKTYACITGRSEGDKQVEGDRKTPEGTFHICYKNPESKYHLSMGLDYPNLDAAERGRKAGLITQEQYDQIATAIKTGGIPNWYTQLGGEIMIHGNATGRSGTAGCIAVSDEDVEELYAVCDVGTVVEVRP